MFFLVFDMFYFFNAFFLFFIIPTCFLILLTFSRYGNIFHICKF